MTVSKLDHYNLRAPRELLDRLCEFYCQVVGLSIGTRPPFSNYGYWLYAGEQAVVHLSQADEDEVCSVDVVTTFGHAAFACRGRASFERRLSELDINYEVAQVPESGQIQLFLKDPAGNGVELSFDKDDR